MPNKKQIERVEGFGYRRNTTVISCGTLPQRTRDVRWNIRGAACSHPANALNAVLNSLSFRTKSTRLHVLARKYLVQVLHVSRKIDPSVSLSFQILGQRAS